MSPVPLSKKTVTAINQSPHWRYPMSDIKPELIEKAAIATYEEMQRPNWRAPQWDEIDAPGQERFLNAARAALETAAPLIAAKALRDFADGMTSGLNKKTLNAERRAIKREARARADQIEKDKGYGF